MRRDEVIACLLMESVMEPTRPTNVEVCDKGGLFFVRFKTILQEFDAVNRNRRIYTLAAMMESLRAPHIHELMSKGSWKGEAGHPESQEVSRILTILPNNTSHKINSFDIKGKLLMGEVETLDDNAEGTRMTKNILQGMEPAFSLRALASLTKRADGISLVQSRAHLVCYDWVILPSHEKAYRDTSSPIQKISKPGFNTGQIMTESNIVIPVMENQITDFIKMESHNVKLISNLHEVALESMQLTADKQNVILREGSNTYLVKVEDRIKHDIRGYMKNL